MKYTKGDVLIGETVEINNGAHAVDDNEGARGSFRTATARSGVSKASVKGHVTREDGSSFENSARRAEYERSGVQPRWGV